MRAISTVMPTHYTIPIRLLNLRACLERRSDFLCLPARCEAKQYNERSGLPGLSLSLYWIISNLNSKKFIGNTWTEDKTGAKIPETDHSEKDRAEWNYSAQWLYVCRTPCYLRLKRLIVGYILLQTLKARRAFTWKKYGFYFSGNDLWENGHLKRKWFRSRTGRQLRLNGYPLWEHGHLVLTSVYNLISDLRKTIINEKVDNSGCHLCHDPRCYGLSEKISRSETWRQTDGSTVCSIPEQFKAAH